jgi:hypothetical protein
MALPLTFDPQGFPVVNVLNAGTAPVVPGTGIVLPPGSITQVTTDAGSFYDDFPGAALATAIVGNVTLTAGLTAWTRVAATTVLRAGDYIYLNADTYTAAGQIDTIAAGGLSGTLRAAYGAAHTVTVAASNVVLTMIGAGSANLDALSLARQLGAGGGKSCLPLRERFAVSIDNRRANQNTLIGVLDARTPALATQGAYVLLSGADAQTQARITTFSGVGVQQQRTVTLPNGDHTDNPEGFEIVVRPDQVGFFAGHSSLGEPLWVHLADPYRPLYLVIAMFDTGVVGGNTIVSVEQIECLEENVIQVQSEQLDPTKNWATVRDATVYVSGTPRAPTNIADNLVHELTDAAGTGMDADKHYEVFQIGGADICIYLKTGAAPAVATCRYGFHLFNGIPREFLSPAAGVRIWACKAVDGTANADCSCIATDGGTGY